jgi:5-formyltetrahydrofolate cyclo-ligase
VDKQDVREQVWARLKAAGAARFPGAEGRIPNFVGAERAAERLAGLEVWAEADTLKANPDAPQLPVRARALADGKVLFIAVPRLREPEPFLRLDPADVRGSFRHVASIRGAAEAGRPTAVEDVPHVDLIVCGSVAVDRRGARLGKGGGFSDLEFALLVEAGRVDERTTIVTTVHPLQVLDERLPETPHDFRVDLIVTPEEVIRPRGARRRPTAILWDHLDVAKVAEVPVLRSLRDRLTPGRPG